MITPTHKSRSGYYSPEHIISPKNLEMEPSQISSAILSNDGIAPPTAAQSNQHTGAAANTSSFAEPSLSNIIVREAAVNIWIVFLLIAVVIVQFVVIGRIRDTSISTQTNLIAADTKHSVLRFLADKTKVIRNHEWLFSTGQVNADAMVTHPRWDELDQATRTPNTPELQQYEAATAPFFTQDSDLVAMYMAMSNLQTWKMHQEKPPVLATQLRYAGVVNGTPFYERYERQRLSNESLNDFVLAKHQLKRYTPLEQKWYNDAGNSTNPVTGEFVGVWQGPEFQGTGPGAASGYGMDPVMIYLKRVQWRDTTKFSTFKLKILTTTVNAMLRSLGIPRNGDIAVVNTAGDIAAHRQDAKIVITDPEDPTNAKKAKVAKVWDIPTFNVVTAADISAPLTGEKLLGDGVTLVAIDDAIPGWRIVIYLDGAVLIESYVPYVNAMLAIAIVLIILSLASIMYSAINIRRNIKDASAATLGHLLQDLLPGEVANKVITREVWPISDTYPNATVMFCDMCNFTKRSSTMSAQELLILLNAIVERFDTRSSQHYVEKVKTIGDCYMAVSGCPVANVLHAPDMISFSLACIRELHKLNDDQSMAGIPPIQFRFGVNSGEVVGGVIGSRRFVFDIFGDTVNLASRMESNSLPMRIRVTEETVACCQGMHSFVGEQQLEVKGKDHTIKTFLVDNGDTVESLLATSIA